MRLIDYLPGLLALTCFYGSSVAAAEPVVTSTPLLSVDEDSPYRYLLKATDADNDPLSWRVKDGEVLPLWLSLTTNAGVTTIAGSGIAAGDDHDDPLLASFDQLWGIAPDGDGDVYVAEFNSFKIRKIAAAVDGLPGGVTTIAGTGEQGAVDHADGLQASFGNIRHIAIDTDGNLYVADASNHKIRRIDGISGAVSTLAGSGLPGSADNNNPALAQFNSPYGIAVDNDGNVYVSASNQIRKIDAVSGAVSTLAGTGELGAGAVDHADPLLASFVNPLGLAVDGDDNVYIADANRIRKIDGLSGAVTTLAGAEAAGAVDHEDPLQASFDHPLAVAVDIGGNIFVADHRNNKIRKIDGRSGAVTTLAGSGAAGDSDNEDGPLATFSLPTAIAADRHGDIYVADWLSHKIRKITPVTPLTGVPDNDDVGTHDIALLVSDSTSAVGHDFTLTVNNINDAPQISGTPLPTVNQDSAYEFVPLASDVDAGDALIFSIVNSPGWAAFDPVTGRLSGTPTREHVGITTDIDISVSDKAGAMATLPAFDLQVLLINSPPQLGGQSLVVAEDAVAGFDLTASDADGDTLTFTVVTAPLHGELGLEGEHGQYAPAANYYGSDRFAIVASDGFADSGPAWFEVTVTPTDDEAVALNDIIHLPLNPQNSVYELVVLANDNAAEVAGDTLTLVGAFSLQGEVWIEDGKLFVDVQDSETAHLSVDYVVVDAADQYARARADVIIGADNRGQSPILFGSIKRPVQSTNSK